MDEWERAARYVEGLKARIAKLEAVRDEAERLHDALHLWRRGRLYPLPCDCALAKVIAASHEGEAANE